MQVSGFCYIYRRWPFRGGKSKCSQNVSLVFLVLVLGFIHKDTLCWTLIEFIDVLQTWMPAICIYVLGTAMFFFNSLHLIDLVTVELKNKLCVNGMDHLDQKLRGLIESYQWSARWHLIYSTLRVCLLTCQLCLLICCTMCLLYLGCLCHRKQTVTII